MGERTNPDSAHLRHVIDLDDIGIRPASGSTPVQGSIPASQSSRHVLVPGSTTAQALFAVWSGQPVVIVDSPPGAGKTTLLIDLLRHLLTRASDLDIVVGCPTRAGVRDVCARLARTLAEAEPDEEKRPAVVFGPQRGEPPEGCTRASPIGRHKVVVNTLASLALSRRSADLLVVDEAYQATFAQVMNAADATGQVLMVGDPGQIGPAVTVRTSVWERMDFAPHVRAPEAFATRPEAKVFRLGSTYRLGPASARAISPLYPFAFDSARPERWITDVSGNRVPELLSLLVPPPAGGYADGPLCELLARTARSYVDQEVTETLTDGSVVSQVLTQRDVAVVVARNVQASLVRAHLDALHAPGVTVGTADSLQGGQWHAVVALDPLVGHDTLTDFHLSQGRLCVMASRHMTSLTWVHDGTALDRLSALEDAPTNAHVEVRRGLISGSD